MGIMKTWTGIVRPQSHVCICLRIKSAHSSANFTIHRRSLMSKPFYRTQRISPATASIQSFESRNHFMCQFLYCVTFAEDKCVYNGLEDVVNIHHYYTDDYKHICTACNHCVWDKHSYSNPTSRLPFNVVLTVDRHENNFQWSKLYRTPWYSREIPI